MTPLWSPAVESRIRAEALNLDPQKVPDHVQMCKRCVVTNQRPRIVFDDEGICSACRFAEHRGTIDWALRERQLRSLLDRHRKEGGYDCIVPCSGGKDSATVAHRLKHEYGMHPLCALFEPFLYTDIGRQNLDAFCHAGFDIIKFQPNGLIHRKLARLAFEYLGDPFHPFVFGQLAYPMQMAKRLGIKLVFGAENGEACYGGDPSANDKHGWDVDDWERVYLKGAGVDRLLEIGLRVGALTDDDVRSLSAFYRLPPRGPQGTSIFEGEPEYHWLAYYLDHHPQGSYYYASENTGFQANPERSEGTFSKYASIDDKLDGLHYFLAYQKFGIGRATSDAAHEIRDGDIEREEGLALVRKYDGEVPRKHMAECLDYLGMDENHFWRVIERFRRPGLSVAA